MDGFFGIGIGELIMIAIVALIVLGPERLPGAFREMAKFIRQIRNLSKEFTDQFGDEFKALEDLNPRRLLQEAIDNIDDEERAKEEAAKPAKKPTPAKPATAAKSTTPAKPLAAQQSVPKPKPAVTPVKKQDKTSEVTAAESTTATTPTGDATATPQDEAANQIAPPELTAAPTPTVEKEAAANHDAQPAATVAQTNGHHPRPKPALGEVDTTVESRNSLPDNSDAAPTPAPPAAEESVVTPGSRQEENQS
jgi:sec-independent protein translocase protein TatB